MTKPHRPERKLRLVTNDELAAILSGRETTGFTTMLHPLELFMARDMLEALTKQSLDAVRSQRQSDETKEQRVAAERSIQQRIDFLAWLQGQPENIYMAIYPADMDGLDELEDLQDLLEDDNPQRDLPF